ncbi:hypothetical protein FXB38_23900 [Bradyrhizobium cytisi]|uniref:Uncharacterized protein n=1 Tax=Bradyrhizobium cytisi TaxID=515489 RepID=A0A5S4WH48_9BRAD|nr:hypothetical protein FXB38_23900 [Bradyrhizobium cytisi]
MQVPYGEGVATHIGPEPCADVRKGDGEASAGLYRPAIEPRKTYHPGYRHSSGSMKVALRTPGRRPQISKGGNRRSWHVGGAAWAMGICAPPPAAVAYRASGLVPWR